jgi:hypothetical protein
MVASQSRPIAKLLLRCAGVLARVKVQITYRKIELVVYRTIWSTYVSMHYYRKVLGRSNCFIIATIDRST